MPAHKLILLPQDPHAAVPAPAALQQCLTDCGLAAPPVTHAGTTFFPTGAHFLQLVSFLGCSPAIELDPPTDPATLDAALASGAFCFLTLASHDRCVFRADAATRPPRCPACRQAVSDWRAAIHDWQTTPSQSGWQCPACDAATDITRLDFRKSAGFGRIFVDIHGIFPSEAVPCDALMQKLASLTDSPWTHIYIKE